MQKLMGFVFVGFWLQWAFPAPGSCYSVPGNSWFLKLALHFPALETLLSWFLPLGIISCVRIILLRFGSDATYSKCSKREGGLNPCLDFLPLRFKVTALGHSPVFDFQILLFVTVPLSASLFSLHFIKSGSLKIKVWHSLHMEATKYLSESKINEALESTLLQWFSNWDSSYEVPRSSSAWPRNLPECNSQIPTSHLLNHKLQGWGLAINVFNYPVRWFWCTLKFDKHSLTGSFVQSLQNVFGGIVEMEEQTPWVAPKQEQVLYLISYWKYEELGKTVLF